MCHAQHHIKLCTCPAPERPENALMPPQFTWTLYRYKGESGVVGKMLMPAQAIGRYLLASEVEKDLNQSGCFDFEYTPVDGDYLTISMANDHSYLAFIFRDGKWTEDFYGVSAICEEMQEGYVQERNFPDDYRINKPCPNANTWNAITLF